MESALWHKVSEQEKEEIKKQAKKILDDFASKLEKIEVKEELYENQSGSRDEGMPWQTDAEFANTMIANAPLVDNNEIIAEKGAWK